MFMVTTDGAFAVAWISGMIVFLQTQTHTHQKKLCRHANHALHIHLQAYTQCTRQVSALTCKRFSGCCQNLRKGRLDCITERQGSGLRAG